MDSLRSNMLPLLLATIVAAGACKKEKDDETPTEGPTTATQTDESATTGEADGPEQETTDVGTADVAPQIVSGEQIYGRVCVTCHGETGDGKGLEQELFGFGAPESEWTNGPTVDGITKTLQTGVHATSMKPFPEYGKAERRAVADYVLQLREELQREQ